MFVNWAVAANSTEEEEVPLALASSALTLVREASATVVVLARVARDIEREQGACTVATETTSSSTEVTD